MPLLGSHRSRCRKPCNRLFADDQVRLVELPTTIEFAPRVSVGTRGSAGVILPAAASACDESPPRGIIRSGAYGQCSLA